jgi:hypothetical protein
VTPDVVAQQLQPDFTEAHTGELRAGLARLSMLLRIQADGTDAVADAAPSDVGSPAAGPRAVLTVSGAGSNG